MYGIPVTATVYRCMEPREASEGQNDSSSCDAFQQNKCFWKRIERSTHLQVLGSTAGQIWHATGDWVVADLGGARALRLLLQPFGSEQPAALCYTRFACCRWPPAPEATAVPPRRRHLHSNFTVSI